MLLKKTCETGHNSIYVRPSRPEIYYFRFRFDPRSVPKIGYPERPTPNPNPNRDFYYRRKNRSRMK